MKSSKLVLMLVSEAALDSFKRSNLWVSRLLIEWETCLLASEDGKCAALPIFIGNEKGAFNFTQIDKDLSADKFPLDRAPTDQKIQCYLSASTTIRKLIKTQGIPLPGHLSIRPILPRISSKVYEFSKYGEESLRKAQETFQSFNPLNGTTWTSANCEIQLLSTNDIQRFCLEVLPNNSSWEYVEFQNMRIRNAEVALLTKAVEAARFRKSWKVTSWRFKNTSFLIDDPKETEELMRAIDSTSITTLYFEKNDMGAKEIAVLMKGLQINEKLDFVLIENDIRDDGVREIAKALRDNDTLTVPRMTLVNIGMTEDGLNELVEALKVNKTLTELTLRSVDIGPEGGKKLASVFKVNTTLKKLSLPSCDIQDDGVTEWGAILPENNSLESLDLFDNYLSSDTATNFAKGLHSNSSLKYLSLEYCGLEVEAFMALGDVLANNNSLEEVNLRRSYAPAGLSHIARSLKTNTRLRKLNLSNIVQNDSSEAGMTEMAIMLKTNRTIEWLDLSMNKLNNANSLEFAAALKENTTLKYLNLSGSPNSDRTGSIQKPGYTALAEAFKVNTTLQTIYLGGNGLIVEGAEDIYNSLKDNSASKICALETLLTTSDNLDGSKRLHVAINNGYWKLIDPLFEKFKQDLQEADTNGWCAIHLACINGNVKTVEKLCNRGADIESKDNAGRRCLHLAAEYGQYPVVEFLLKKGASIESESNYGLRPIHYAVFYTAIQAVDVLCKANADLNTRNPLGENVLHYAVTHGPNLKLWALLLEHGAEINSVNPKNSLTPLHICASKEAPFIELLCCKGANLEAQDDAGQTPLFKAVEHENADGIAALVRAGAKIESQDSVGNTPLLHALSLSDKVKDENKYFEMLKALIQHGSNVNARNNHDATPLTIACRLGSLKICEYLIETGAEVNAEDGNGNNTLSCASLADNVDTAKLLLLLKHPEFDINAKNRNGTTCLILHLTRKPDDVETVRLLCDNGADVNAKTNFGESPLMMCIKHHNVSSGDVIPTMKLLLERGADPFACQNDKYDSFAFAALSGNIDIFNHLMQVEKKLDTVTIYGYTLLHLAMFNPGESRKITEFLLENGLDVNARDNDGMTPLMRLAQNQHLAPDLPMMLVDHGADLHAKDNNGMCAYQYALSSAADSNNTIYPIWETLYSEMSDVNIRESHLSYTALICAIHSHASLDFIRLLCDKGTDINAAGWHNGTALLGAIWWSTIEVFDLILSYKPEVDLADADGDTPLHNAVFQHNTDGNMMEHIRKLCEAGADPTKVNRQGFTPLDTTEKDDCREYLEEYEQKYRAKEKTQETTQMPETYKKGDNMTGEEMAVEE